jgi:hypothetical protein
MQTLGHVAPCLASHHLCPTSLSPKMHRPLLFASTILSMVLVSACSNEPTAIHEGTYLTIPEQVAIEYAAGKLADSVAAHGATQADTVIADFARVLGRLVRLEGRVETVTVQLPTGGSATMQAAVMHSSGTIIGAPVEAQFALAWEGLDATSLTVRRAVLLLGAGAASGTYDMAASSASNLARFVDLAPGSAAVVWHNVGGSFSVTGGQFQGGCSGIESGDGESCEVGRATVAASVDFATGATTGRASLPSTTLPAFQVVTK